MPAAPPLSDDEKIAVLAVLTRYQRLLMANEVDEKIRDEAEARIADREVQFGRLQAAFSAFGFDVEKDGGFKEVWETTGVDAYWAALERGGYVRETASQSAESSGTNAAQSQVEAVAEGNEPPNLTEGETLTVRDLVLDSLKAARGKGRKAAEIQAQIEARRGQKLHPKTCGMTLYRLSQEGLARRDGRTWFYVPTKNAGVSPPGSAEYLED